MKQLLFELQIELEQIEYNINIIPDETIRKNINIKIQDLINKIIILHSDSISISNILYLVNIELEIDKIKTYMKRY